MKYTRPDVLSRWQHGLIRVRNQADLDLILACSESISDHESIQFDGLRWDDDADGIIAVSDYAADAAQQVIAAGILPEPSDELPTIGSRVETIEVGGRPSPACRYGIGTVTGLSWNHVSHDWRVDVEFDECTGGWQGYPIFGTHTFPWMVHVIDGSGRPFSTMSPKEIEQLYQELAARHRVESGHSHGGGLTQQEVVTSTEDDEDEGVHYGREAPLAHFGSGPLWVFSPGDLDALLACRQPIAEGVAFTCGWDPKNGVTPGQWVSSAIERVVAAGLLPPPTEVLPEIDSRVETICLTSRQIPKYGYAVGSVMWIGWRPDTNTWGVDVRFDEPVQLRRGGRIKSMSSILSMVRSIAGDERLFSSMGPDEIKNLFERLRPPKPS